ncbi:MULTISPECIES: hypothetical protein, partial [unclassified Saccharothrix]|uniref:hypothetical protein n=1 Tax=unclassified Saccharothrix TaxID=2593673 RepID=UPI00307E6C68
MRTTRATNQPTSLERPGAQARLHSNVREARVLLSLSGTREARAQPNLGFFRHPRMACPKGYHRFPRVQP